jgi:hypothetical protein
MVAFRLKVSLLWLERARRPSSTITGKRPELAKTKRMDESSAYRLLPLPGKPKPGQALLHGWRQGCKIEMRNYRVLLFS